MVDYDVVDSVAIITCQNPPVNQLSRRLRLGLVGGLAEALKDDSVTSIIIIGGGRTFPAGADIQFSQYYCNPSHSSPSIYFHSFPLTLNLIQHHSGNYQPVKHLMTLPHHL